MKPAHRCNTLQTVRLAREACASFDGHLCLCTKRMSRDLPAWNNSSQSKLGWEFGMCHSVWHEGTTPRYSGKKNQENASVTMSQRQANLAGSYSSPRDPPQTGVDGSARQDLPPASLTWGISASPSRRPLINSSVPTTLRY